MSIWDETESLDNKSAQNIESNFSFDMSKEEQDSFFLNIAQETSKLSSDRKNELFELFVQKSGILNNSSENKYLKNPILGMRFLSQFFANSDKESEIEKLYQEFDDFVMNDFAKMSNEIAIKNQAELYDRALTIKEELYEDIRFVELTNKSIIGIGGSFSAGKSSFLNSILNSKEDILPVETRPTTSIPTYVLASDKNAIYTFNQYGDKAQIGEEGMRAISHEFNNVYGFGLSSIIKNIVVYSKDMPYQNITFLDTPGYSKQDGYNQTDKKIAKEYLEDIGALIWLIDSDNGTIRKTDIDFLNELEIKESVNVLFVINKADKKPQSELKQIVESAKESLAKNFKHAFSITAYSSHDKKEYFGEDKIKRFLEAEDKTPVFNALYENFRDIFDIYDSHLKEVRESSKKLLGVFNKLDVIGNSIVSTIDGYEYLEKSVKDRVVENKRETELYEEVRKKGLTLLYKILNDMGVRVDTYSGCGTKSYANGDKYVGEWADGKKNGLGVLICGNGTKYDGEWKDDKKNGHGIIYLRNGDKLEVEWREGKPNGLGVITYANGNKIDGDWKNNGQDGRGIIIFTNKDKYDGAWKDGIPSGRGVMAYADGDKYDGEWNDGNRHGRGVMTYYVRGMKYDGEWNDGNRHGRGVETSDDGTKYDGEWNDGNRQGRGVETSDDGTKYDGEWKDGNYNGRGVMAYANGDKYDGEWKDGAPNGRGIVTFNNGTKYDGEWKDGERSGSGIMTNADGDKYDGDWKDGSPNGRGIVSGANGDKYDGEWKDGSPNGRGVMAYANGDKYDGEWKDGNLSGQGIMVYASGDKYDGEYKDGKRNGRGIYHWIDREKYDGVWKDDKRNGQGIMIYSFFNGKYNGEWKDDKRNGEGIMSYGFLKYKSKWIDDKKA